MAKKSVRKKPSAKRAVSKKKIPKRKINSRGKKAPMRSTQKKPELKNIASRLRRSNISLIYSLAVFIISLILYLITYNFLESLFGFIAVVSGALVLMFAIVSIILYSIKKKG